MALIELFAQMMIIEIIGFIIGFGIIVHYLIKWVVDKITSKTNNRGH